MKLWKYILILFFVCGLLFAKDSEKKNTERDADASSKTPAQGCCRIKMAGGGYDYFVATEAECTSNKQFHSFLKERTLCFESFPE
ncbi:hypothetical protein A0128_07235 [Leptospira tipperaryensis]|uniref:Uncharacterized protein n=2 Tax=Leptospira tipperaryensis TaxID=2564040 RepID=A0A1D7V2B4_9LEPT|nr:hypothetical protein [Leptospira tipperaryensis]AOP35969.1 hypothetical protein A0128_07235 [Leptospira tipperaryensis]